MRISRDCTYCRANFTDCCDECNWEDALTEKHMVESWRLMDLVPRSGAEPCAVLDAQIEARLHESDPEPLEAFLLRHESTCKACRRKPLTYAGKR